MVDRLGSDTLYDIDHIVPVIWGMYVEFSFNLLKSN